MKLLHSILLFFFFTHSLLAQTEKNSVLNAHAHNDYQNASPFFKAYNQGFGSIEADVFAVNGELYVAHDRKEIQESRTLNKLYLEPLGTKLKKDTRRRIRLLIDIKDEYAVVLPLLIKQLQPLKSYLLSKRLVVNISGNRPLPAAYRNYPGFIYFDDDLVHDHTPEQWARVGLVSLRFGVFSTWKGDSPIPPAEEDRLRRIINSVHNAGKEIRFWGAPDTQVSWQVQRKLGVDLIGTDQIEALGTFLLQNDDNPSKVDE